MSRRRPHRIKKEVPIYKNRYFWIIIGSILLIAIIAYLIVFFDFFQIKSIKIEGNETTKTSAIRKLVKDNLPINLFLFSSRSIFLARLKKVRDKALKRFPEIYKIELHRDLPDSVRVKIKERKPVGVFVVNSQKLLIDKKGVVFKKKGIQSEQEDNDFYFKKKGLKKPPSLRKEIISKDLMGKILTIRSKLNKANIKTKGVKIIPSKRLNFETKDEWEVYFDPEKEIEWQVTRLEVVLQEEILSHERKDLEYIDLRFQKVYYK